MSMKRIAFTALLGAMLFGIVSGAAATDLKVKGNLDVYGMWSANLRDFSSDNPDGDNYMTTQRFRSYFTFVTNENLKAILGLETNNVWGQGDASDWGTDGVDNLQIKHSYLDFNYPDTALNVKAGLQYIGLPGVFGNPFFDDDAAALVVSTPINDMFGITAGYTRGIDDNDNYDSTIGSTADLDKDDVDMAFVVAPLTFDGFNVSPYFGYAWIGENSGWVSKSQQIIVEDDANIWMIGANAKLTLFDPLTFAADVIYADLDSDDYETMGWYAALAGSYKLDMLTATIFTTYATGADDDAGEDNYLPTLREDWKVTPYLSGARAFSTGYDSFATNTLGVGSDGTGLWTMGLILDKISFVENLSHKVTVAYFEGTSDEGTNLFTEEDSGWEVYVVNQYNIYENLAAINELGYFSASSEGYEDANPDGDDMDASYFATIGFQYKF